MPRADYDNIDWERLRWFEAALRLAIAERTGTEPLEVDGLSLHAHPLDDHQRACEIFDACYPAIEDSN